MYLQGTGTEFEDTQNMNTQIEVRDSRDGSFLWVDNDYLDTYAKLVGVNGTCVYFALCKFANKTTQKCFPSMETIAEMYGIHRRTVSKALRELEELNIVKAVRSKDKESKRFNVTVYHLIDKKEWVKKPCDSRSHGNEANSHVTSGHNNNTKGNNINIINSKVETLHSKVPELIDAFKEVNAAYKKWFGNKTQREACDRLISTHSFETVLQVIKVLPKTNLTDFAPRVYTPLQLEDKWSSLKDFYKKKQTSSQEIKKKILFS